MHITESTRTRGIILIDHNFRVVHKIVNRTLLLDQCYLKKIKDKKKLKKIKEESHKNRNPFGGIVETLKNVSKKLLDESDEQIK